MNEVLTCQWSQLHSSRSADPTMEEVDRNTSGVINLVIYDLHRRRMRSTHLRSHTCLLANISKTASLSSSSANIRINSSRASPIRSLSLLSTTKISPCKMCNRKEALSLELEHLIFVISFAMSTYLCVLEVMPPKWTNLVLTAHIPNCKTNILVFYSLDVETCMKWVIRNANIE